MRTIESYLTEQTCGEACWSAREDICRCSCNGKHHGCLREDSGARPTRSAKIDGYRYELQAIGYNDVSKIADELNADSGLYIRSYGTSSINYSYGSGASRDRMYIGSPAKIRCASASQVERWPELAAYRNLETSEYRPYLLWIKVA